MSNVVEKLKNLGKKGFRQPTKAQIKDHLKEKAEDRAKRAKAFMNEYTEIVKKHGIEIYGRIEQFKDGLARPTLHLRDWTPPEEPKTKEWSQALQENLETRATCQHQLDEESTICEKCRLNPENWGADGKGVSPAYREKMEKKIEEEKGKEAMEKAACAKGEHELNDEAKKDTNAPMAFCVKCRVAKSDWGKKPEETKVE